MSRRNSDLFASIDDFKSAEPSKAERRRLEIVEGTIHELATRGIQGITHETVAERCGVSRTLVRHYFPAREDLIRTAFRFVRARFQDLCIREIEKESAPRARLEVYAATACAWLKLLPRDARVWLLFYFYCGFDPAYRKVNTEFVETGHRRIIALLEEIDGKSASRAKNRVSRAKLIQNAITGCFISTATENHSPEILDGLIATAVEECLAIIDK